jgi:hypothetical protein
MGTRPMCARLLSYIVLGVSSPAIEGTTMHPELTYEVHRAVLHERLSDAGEMRQTRLSGAPHAPRLWAVVRLPTHRPFAAIVARLGLL